MTGMQQAIARQVDRGMGREEGAPPAPAAEPDPFTMGDDYQRQAMYQGFESDEAKMIDRAPPEVRTLIQEDGGKLLIEMTKDARTGIPIERYRRRMTPVLARIEANRAGVSLDQVSEQVRNHFLDKGNARAQSLIQDWMSQATDTGLVFVDHDPTGSTRELAKWGKQSPVHRLLAILSAEVTPFSHKYLTPKTGATDVTEEPGISKVPTDEWLTWSGAEGSLGTLGFLGRFMAPSTYVYSTAKAMYEQPELGLDAIGSERHLEILRNGEDIIDATRPIGRQAADTLQAMGIISKESADSWWVQSALGAPVTMGITMMEPDFFSVAMGLGGGVFGGGPVGSAGAYALGKFGKGGLLATRMGIRNFDTLAKGLDELGEIGGQAIERAARTAAAGGEGVDTRAAIETLLSQFGRKGNMQRGASEVLQDILGSALDVENNPGVAISNMARRAVDGEKALQEARSKLASRIDDVLSSTYEKHVARQSKNAKQLREAEDLKAARDALRRGDLSNPELMRLAQKLNDKEAFEASINAIVNEHLLARAMQSRAAYAAKVWPRVSRGARAAVETMDVAAKRYHNAAEALYKAADDTAPDAAQKLRDEFYEAGREFHGLQGDLKASHRQGVLEIANQRVVDSASQLDEINAMLKAGGGKPVPYAQAGGRVAQAVRAEAQNELLPKVFRRATQEMAEEFRNMKPLIDKKIPVPDVNALYKALGELGKVGGPSDGVDDMFRQALGADTVNSVMQRGGPLVDAYRSLSAPGRKLTDADAATLSRIAEAMGDEFSHVWREQQGISRGMVALQRSLDPKSVDAVFNVLKPRTWAPGAMNMAKNLRNAFDPDSKYGTMTEDVVDVFKAKENLSNLGIRELTDLSDDVGNYVPNLKSYLTTMEPIELRAGRTLLNTMGRNTLWKDMLNLVSGMGESEAMDSNILTGMARMWIGPQGNQLAEKAAGALKHRAYKLLSTPIEEADGARRLITYDEFVGRMKSLTQGLNMTTEPVEARAHGILGTMVMEAATRSRMVEALQRTAGGVTGEMATEVTNLLKGNFEDVTDPLGVMDTLMRYGWGTTAMRDMEEGTKEMFARVVRSGDKADATGLNALVPAAVLNHMDANLSRAVKEVHRFNPANGAAVGAVSSWARTVYRWYKASMTTGLLLPNPRHWTNIMVGNHSQIYLEAGARQATAVSFNSLRYLIPGRHWHRAMDRIQERIAVATGQDHALGTFVNAMNNPYIARFFDPRLADDAATIVGNNGRVHTWGQLRNYAASEGVLSTFVSSELMDNLSRAALRSEGLLDKATRVVKQGQKNIENHAHVVEQRQRVALFLEMVVNQGRTPRQAAQVVKNALYDWNHALADFETKWMLNYLLFWRFWRLAMRQATDAVMSPYNMGVEAGGPLKGALANLQPRFATKMGRLQTMAQGISALGRPDVNAEYEELRDTIYRPWWEPNSPRGVSPSWANPPQDTAWSKDALGREYTHSALIMPAFTPIDSINILLQSGHAISALAWDGAGAAGLHSKDASGSFFDNMMRVIEPASVMLSPVHGAGAKRAMDILTHKPGHPASKLSDNEVAMYQNVLRHVPGFADTVWRDKYSGRYEMDPTALAMWRMMPLAGLQMPYLVGSVSNKPPSIDESYAKTAAHVFGNLTGFGKRVPIEVVDDVENQGFAQREFEAQFKQWREAADYHKLQARRERQGLE